MDGKFGLDHCFLFDKDKKQNVSLFHEKSGRELILTTNQNALIVYTGNWMEGIAPYDSVIDFNYY